MNPDFRLHLQRLDVLEFVGIPLFDLLIFPRCEEQMGLGDELEEHDAAGKQTGSQRRDDVSQVSRLRGKTISQTEEWRWPTSKTKRETSREKSR